MIYKYRNYYSSYEKGLISVIADDGCISTLHFCPCIITLSFIILDSHRLFALLTAGLFLHLLPFFACMVSFLVSFFLKL